MKSEKTDAWETVVIYRRAASPHAGARQQAAVARDEQRKEQAEAGQGRGEARHTKRPQQRARREAEFEKQREKDREFLREVPDLFDFQLLGDEKIDGHDVWVISATPKPGAQPKHGDAKPLLKIQAKVWIDQGRVSMGAPGSRDHRDHFVRIVYRAAESGSEAGIRADPRERRSVAAQARDGARRRRGSDW